MTLPQPSGFSAMLRGGGQRVPMLPETVRRRRLMRSIRSEAALLRSLPPSTRGTPRFVECAAV